MNSNLKLINSLIYEYDCSLKVFNARYDGGIYVILGYDYLIEGIEALLTGGDNDWDYCSCELSKYNNLPIVLVYPENSNIIEGLKEIEKKISNSTKDISLKEYLGKISTIFSNVIN